MKPQSYKEAIQDKELRRTAMVNDIFTMFEANTIPAFEALAILNRVIGKTLECQESLNRAYSRRIIQAQKEIDRS